MRDRAVHHVLACECLEDIYKGRVAGELVRQRLVDNRILGGRLGQPPIQCFEARHEKVMYPPALRRRNGEGTASGSAVGRVALAVGPKPAFRAIAGEQVRLGEPELSQEPPPVTPAFRCRSENRPRIVRDEMAPPVIRRIRRNGSPHRASSPCLAKVDGRRGVPVLELQPLFRRATFEDLTYECVPSPQRGRFVKVGVPAGAKSMPPQLFRHRSRDVQVHSAGSVER